MSKIGDRHFVEAGWTGGHNQWIPASVMSVVRDSIVHSCSDNVVIGPDKKILLVRRVIDPAKGEMWVIGGKQNPGETWVQSAQRHLLCDTELDIELHRFHHVGVYSTVFARRQEAPCENGTHTNNFTYAVQVTATEIAQIKFRLAEYADGSAQWLTADEVERGVENGEVLLPLTTIVSDLRRNNLL